MSDILSYNITLINGSNYNAIRHLTKQEYDYYSNITSVLMKLSHQNGLYKIVKHNYIDIYNKIIEHGDVLINDRSRFKLKEVYLDLNRLILNFLSSVKMYLDHNSSLLKEYGEEVIQFFEKETRWAYDNHFSYRFLYKLRNYAQHKGLPSGSININSTLNEKGETENILTLLLNSNFLLSNFDKWGTVKADLELQSDKFNLLPLIDEKFIILEEIQTRIYSLLCGQHYNVACELFNLIDDASYLGNGYPVLASYEQSKDGKFRILVNDLPYDLISGLVKKKFNFYRKIYGKDWNYIWPHPPLLSPSLRWL